MTDGIDIHLTRLIEAVNSPDWWAIGITVVNALIMVWLGYNQYRLQKRQTQLQELQTRQQDYETYKKLYVLLSSANAEIDSFLFNLNDSLWEPRYAIDKEYLKRKQKYIDTLWKDLSDSYIDYELKFSKETFNKSGYLRILSLMSRLIQQTLMSLEKGEVIIAQGTQRIPIIDNKVDEAYSVAITRHFTNPFLQGILMQNFDDFIKQKNDVRCDNAILEEIRTKCKID